MEIMEKPCPTWRKHLVFDVISGFSKVLSKVYNFFHSHVPARAHQLIAGNGDVQGRPVKPSILLD